MNVAVHPARAGFPLIGGALRGTNGTAARRGTSGGRAMGSGVSDPESLDASWSVLMAAAQAGDKVAYGRLLRECTPLIRRVVHRGMQPDRVDDVVQDVLLTIHRARQTYDPTRSFSAWVVTIAQRRAIDLLRHRGRHDRREVHAPIDYENYAGEDADYDREVTLEQRGKVLQSALSSLPPGQRQAIEALALRQLSLDEAAGVTGKSKGALKVNMHRALKSLRERFGAPE
jgi:RNA polymerase sigma factor (sigma-70 family)